MRKQRPAQEKRAGSCAGAILMIAVLLLRVPAGFCDSKTAGSGSGKYDVSMLATLMKIKPMKLETVVDAIEKGPEQMSLARYVAVFKIERVLRGQFNRLKARGTSKMDQAKDALKGKNFLKVLTMDFDDPEIELEQGWLSVAVEDPVTAFKLPSLENPGEGRYRIYLKRFQGQTDSYVMVKNERRD